MSYIIFSRQFPKGHPRSGEKTNFVEKIMNGLVEGLNCYGAEYKTLLGALNPTLTQSAINNLWEELDEDDFDIKHHTIRAGNRWKVGDKFSPRVWSGKPYCSKQIIIAPDIEIKKIKEFIYDGTSYRTDGWYHADSPAGVGKIAKNDGLSMEDFKAWFSKPFIGQVIIWNDKIEY